LSTQVNSQQYSQNNTQNSLQGLLGAVLNTQGNQNQQNIQYASITAPVQIPNAFNLHFEFSAMQDAKRFDLGMYRNNNDGGYFLSYTPTMPWGITISVTLPGQAARQIAHSGVMNLNGGQTRAIDWKRDRDGRMTVAVDGTTIITVTD